ncbi:phosphonate ABC transporter, permease protein PhnE [Ruania alba]|uniref:Phosphonate transport system permease protein n=1 Tax=Ruania alba TaxID=648782 RepID=A0A1H5LZU5_9MICO|nr:phosphonate ABC transporter, permease protein PhnE [Ruania alba]SEE82500.1 phosphonate transport system permease protein [Ruania alba]
MSTATSTTSPGSGHRPGPGGDDLPLRPRTDTSTRLLTLTLLVVLGAACWSVQALHINIATLIDGWDNTVDFLSRTFPFTLPGPGEIWDMVAQTLAIVALATVLGLIVSVPLAFLAAKNTCGNRSVRTAARVLIVLERAVPDFIVATFFVRAVGLGALPGIIALGLGSVGMMGKLFADAIEEIDPGPREALRAAGAGQVQQIVGGILPQLRPQIVATTLHAFDINLRGSVILGFVGVSGIGMHISAALETMNYRLGMGLSAVLLVLCLLAELVSGLIRKQMLGGTDTSRPSRWSSVFRAHLPSPSWIRSEGSTARVSPPWTGRRIRTTGWNVLIVVAVIVSLLAADISVRQLSSGLANAIETLALYVPPSTGGIGEKLLATMLETIQMGLAGTLVGLVLAIPFGLLSARNVSPGPRVAATFRACVVAIRAIPGIIIGICFVVITGLGATAGALALSIGAIGFFAKVIADSLEEVDVRVQDAVRASGAGDVQVFFAATLRQVAPALAAHTMHQLDTNLRAATGLGVIGAGGIGFYMTNASRVLEFGVVTTCLILVVATVLLSEALALWTRKKVQ